MAPKKKPKQYKPKASSGSPSTTLVIFLVVFVLVSIITGVAAYYGYAGQEEFKQAAKKAAADADAAKKAKDWFEFVELEARAAHGGPFKKDQAVDEMNSWQILREDFKSGKFNNEQGYAEVQKFVEQNEKTLVFNPTTKNYNTTYTALLGKLQGEVAKAAQDLDKARKDKKAAEEAEQYVKTSFEPALKDKIKEIDDANKKSLGEAQAKHETFKQVLGENDKLKQERVQMTLDHAKVLRDKDRLFNELKAEFEKLAASRGGSGVTMRSSTQHALLLDVSQGKSLWDRPKGKVSRVNANDRTVNLSIGSGDGVFPQLTFNVFAAGWDGKASGQLKGTVEVVKILGDHLSEARITSLYDNAGQPVPLFDINQGALLRAAENPIKEGDLIFNMVWGSRVAFAGRVNLGGGGSYSSVEDMRLIKQLFNVLRSQGVSVDAYLDLTDGQIKGEITPETTFLILGEKAYEDPNRLEQDPMIASPKVVNAKMDEMRKMALEQGLFLISTKNFGAVAGYRPPQSSESSQLSSFRPRLPAAPTLSEAPPTTPAPVPGQN